MDEGRGRTGRMTAPAEGEAPAVRKGLGHRTIAAAAADELRRRILDGSYPGGRPLRQDALAEEFRISRIPVREALLQLEAEGLVRILPHRGAIVSELSIEEIEDIFELRALLEPRLLRRPVPGSGARISTRSAPSSTNTAPSCAPETPRAGASSTPPFTCASTPMPGGPVPSPSSRTCCATATDTRASSSRRRTGAPGPSASTPISSRSAKPATSGEPRPC